MTAVLLDTCALIWITEGASLRQEAIDAVGAASQGGGVLVSPVSAWEVGLLAKRDGSVFLPDAKQWFERLLSGVGVKLVALTPAIAIDSSFLPGDFHKDPADRLIVATARTLRVPVMTGDRAILDYATSGHVSVIRCR